MKKTTFICTLPRELQEKIYYMLMEVVPSIHDVVAGMGGRICDLEDTIDIREVLQWKA